MSLLLFRAASTKVTGLNHVAIATKCRDKHVTFYKNVLGLNVSDRMAQPEHGVYTTFIDTGDTKIELLEQLGDNSPIAAFVEKTPEKVHHMCLKVQSINKMMKRLKDHDIKVLGDEPKIGAHGRPVVFIHPKYTGGILIELEEE